MDAELRAYVQARADERREYCGLPASFTDAPFQVDHVVATKHGGPTHEANLAWSCFWCNSFKGPNVAGWSEEVGAVVRVFPPRQDRWKEHFAWEGPILKGLTSVGRVTIAVLRINDPEAVEVRRLLLKLGISIREGSPGT